MNIKEIAMKCGVSTATVSRVINNNPHVSEKTREHVNAVIRREGYTPNAFARGLGLDSMNMVGILCTDVADLFYAGALSRLETSLRAAGLDTLLCCTGNRLEDKKQFLCQTVEKRVDAVILVGSAFREEKDNAHIREAASRVPVIIINGRVDIPNVYCVVCDEREAMRMNVHRLADAGCGNLLYLYDSGTYSGAQKLAGFYMGMAECGLEEREECVAQVQKDVEAATKAVAALIARFPDIDGILASDDILAVGAGKALAAKGRRVPVIGFNNSIYAECATPAVTSVDNCLNGVCDKAVELLRDLLDGKEAPSETVLPANLAERETFKVIK